MTSPTLDTTAGLVADLVWAGVRLEAAGDNLRYRPQSAMTADLVERLRDHKPELLFLLAAPGYGRHGWTRRQAAYLIRNARQRDPGQAVALRDAWRERMTVCIIDGNLSEDQAEQVALAELEAAS